MFESYKLYIPCCLSGLSAESNYDMMELFLISNWSQVTNSQTNGDYELLCVATISKGERHSNLSYKGQLVQPRCQVQARLSSMLTWGACLPKHCPVAARGSCLEPLTTERFHNSAAVRLIWRLIGQPQQCLYVLSINGRCHEV